MRPEFELEDRQDRGIRRNPEFGRIFTLELQRDCFPQVESELVQRRRLGHYWKIETLRDVKIFAA